MKYMLTIQLDSGDIEAYDRLIELEDLIAEEVASDEEVDGHDVGATEMNIFIVANSPRETFQRLMSRIPQLAGRSDLKVAYRKLDGEVYTIIWPEDLCEFSVK
jgi:hypothetical protein